MGFRTEFTSLTSGTGIMTFSSAGHDREVQGLVTGRKSGVLISNATGRAVAYALFNLQIRGRLMVRPGTEVYEGMVVGIHSRSTSSWRSRHARSGSGRNGCASTSAVGRGSLPSRSRQMSVAGRGAGTWCELCLT